MLALDGDAEQPGEAGKEVRIRNIELAGFGTVDFEDAERQVAFAAAGDQDVDGAPDAMIREELGRSKSRFLLEVVGNDHLSGLESVAGRGLQVDAKRNLADRPWSPSDAGTHQQAFVVRHILQDFGEPGFEALGAELGGTLQDLCDVAGLQRRAAELAQQRLLPQAVRKLFPGDISRYGRGRYRLLPRLGRAWNWSVKSGSRQGRPETLARPRQDGRDFAARLIGDRMAGSARPVSDPWVATMDQAMSCCGGWRPAAPPAMSGPSWQDLFERPAFATAKSLHPSAHHARWHPANSRS